MDERAFSNILSASLRIADTAKVEKLRDASLRIVEDFAARPDAVHILCGLRGVGKTTVLSEVSTRFPKSVYLSGDVILQYGADLLEILHHAEKSGHDMFLVDEVHAVPEWEKSLKIFYDETHANILASGSSAAALKAKGSELSRRAKIHELKPLSFREYLVFRTGQPVPSASLNELLDPEKRPELSKRILPYLQDFEPYLMKYGLPASFFGSRTDAYINIVERVIRYDLEILRDVDAAYVDAAFRIVKFVASSAPGEVSYSKIASSLQRSVKFVIEAVHLLSMAGLFYIIPPHGMGHAAIRSEDKILMPLSFRSALCEAYGVQPSAGGLREDFFIQHVPSAQYIKTGAERRTPDFQVGASIFEVGGPTKGWEQLKGRKNSYLVKEATGGTRNEIPLYLFGLLY